jgi:hypothetical protein
MRSTLFFALIDPPSTSAPHSRPRKHYCRSRGCARQPKDPGNGGVDYDSNETKEGDGVNVTTQIGFIGLGVMGTAMAESLARADFGVTAFDIDTTKVTQLTRRFRNIKAAASPRQVASRCGIVITILPSGEHVRDVALGSDGLMHGFEGGELLIDISSCEPWLTLETAAALAKRGVAMVDSPTSGAEAGANASVSELVRWVERITGVEIRS